MQIPCSASLFAVASWQIPWSPLQSQRRCSMEPLHHGAIALSRRLQLQPLHHGAIALSRRLQIQCIALSAPLIVHHVPLQIRQAFAGLQQNIVKPDCAAVGACKFSGSVWACKFSRSVWACKFSRSVRQFGLVIGVGLGMQVLEVCAAVWTSYLVVSGGAVADLISPRAPR